MKEKVRYTGSNECRVGTRLVSFGDELEVDTHILPYFLHAGFTRVKKHKSKSKTKLLGNPNKTRNPIQGGDN